MRMTISLAPDELERLAKLAHTERRRPQDQAAVLIAKSLGDTPSNTGPDQREHDDAARETAVAR